MPGPRKPLYLTLTLNHPRISLTYYATGRGLAPIATEKKWRALPKRPPHTCHSKSNRAHSRLSAASGLSFTRTASNLFHRAGFVFSSPCFRRALTVNLPNPQYCMKSHNAPPQYHSGLASPTFCTLPYFDGFCQCLHRPLRHRLERQGHHAVTFLQLLKRTVNRGLTSGLYTVINKKIREEVIK